MGDGEKKGRETETEKCREMQRETGEEEEVGKVGKFYLLKRQGTANFKAPLFFSAV